MAQATQPNETDFMVAFRGLLTQAQVHGVNHLDENVRQFLVHTAEVMAQQHAETREANNAMHRAMQQRSE